jgi:hypothetical protein
VGGAERRGRRRAGVGRPQVFGLRRDGAAVRVAGRVGGPRLRAQPVQLRRLPRRGVLRHERLRPLRARDRGLHDLLERSLVAARVDRGAVLGARHRQPDEAAHASGAGPTHAWARGGDHPDFVGVARQRRLHLLQHQHPQSVSAQRRAGRAAGSLRARVQAIRRAPAAAHHRGRRRRRDLSLRTPRRGSGRSRACT